MNFRSQRLSRPWKFSRVGRSAFEFIVLKVREFKNWNGAARGKSVTHLDTHQTMEFDAAGSAILLRQQQQTVKLDNQQRVGVRKGESAIGRVDGAAQEIPRYRRD